MPNHFEHTQDGRLMIASGFDSVITWTGRPHRQKFPA